jgi:hypothetical protein
MLETISPKQVCDRFSVPSQAYQDWQSARRIESVYVRVRYLRKIAKTYGRTIFFLLLDDLGEYCCNAERKQIYFDVLTGNYSGSRFT